MKNTQEIRRILVGIDGSPESRRAAEHAVQLAAATGSAVEFAHVLPQITEFGPHAAFAFTAGLPRTEHARVMLHQFSESVPSPNIRVDTSLLEGRPAEELAHEADRPDVWLVVVGHRGRGATGRVLLGSIADRLTQISPKPVLVVR